MATIGAIEDAIKDGSNWVLKPQREGGGNNLYGVELSAFLNKHGEDPVLSGMYPFILCDICNPIYYITETVYTNDLLFHFMLCNVVFCTYRVRADATDLP